MKQLLILFSIAITAPLYSFQSNQFNYVGVHKDYPIMVKFEFVDESVENDIEQIKIICNIDTDKIQEKNTTIIRNNRLFSMFQTTKNEVDGEYFEWYVIKNEENYDILFKNVRYFEEFRTKMSVKEEPHTIQSLLFLLQESNLQVNDVLQANLLIPWNRIIPIRLIVKEKERLEFGNQLLDTLKINLELGLFIGRVLPKAVLWVSEESPHVLLKHKGMGKEYQLLLN